METISIEQSDFDALKKAAISLKQQFGNAYFMKKRLSSTRKVGIVLVEKTLSKKDFSAIEHRMRDQVEGFEVWVPKQH